jgi:hypothetical protein
VSITTKRYREASLTHFRKVLSAWLTKLPPDGWVGTVSDLEDGLWDIARHDPVPAFIPRRNGLGRRIASEVGFLSARGFRVEFRRTKRERTIRFARNSG